MAGSLLRFTESAAMSAGACRESWTRMDDAVTEKRRFARYEINVPVRVRLLTEEDEIIYAGTSNLSAEGVLLHSERPIPEGSLVKMDIFLDFEELVSAADPEGIMILTTTGRVTRSGQHGTAIRFNGDYAFRVAGLPQASEALVA
jgi:hypothetical protein